MTSFTKENLRRDGAVVEYFDGTGRYFVARFKYGRESIGPFMTFLRKNFTVEEYFDRRAAGETPLGMVESKGFVLSHIKKWLKRDGYPTTQAGYRQWTEDRRAEREAARAAS